MWDANELKASQSKVPHVTCSDLVWRRHVSRIWCILSSPLCCSVLYTASRPTNRQDDLRVRSPCTRPDLTPTRRRREGAGWSVWSGGNWSCWVDRERASQVWPILCWAGDLLTISTTPGPSTSATGWRYGEGCSVHSSEPSCLIMFPGGNPGQLILQCPLAGGETGTHPHCRRHAGLQLQLWRPGEPCLAPLRPGGNKRVRHRVQARGQVQQRAGQISQHHREAHGTNLEKHSRRRLSLVFWCLCWTPKEKLKDQSEEVKIPLNCVY